MSVRGAASAVGLAIVVATCGPVQAQAPAVPPTADPLLRSTPSVRAALPAPVKYDRRARRDPFRPVEIPVPPPPPPPVVKPVIPEVKLVVATARLKGILRGSTTRALVETPDGIGYIMKAGDTLAEGRLVEIGPDRVVFSVAPRPGLATDRVVLRLPSD